MLHGKKFISFILQCPAGDKCTQKQQRLHPDVPGNEVIVETCQNLYSYVLWLYKFFTSRFNLPDKRWLYFLTKAKQEVLQKRGKYDRLQQQFSTSVL